MNNSDTGKLIRDKKTNAIINHDQNQYQSFLLKRQEALKAKENESIINTLSDRVTKLEAELVEIRRLLNV